MTRMSAAASTPSLTRPLLVLGAGAGLLAIATLALWWRARRGGAVRVASSTPLPPHANSAAHRAAFLRASALGELAGAERALVAWARSERPDVRNLGELSQQLGDAAQRDALIALQRARYAGAGREGVGQKLERAFKAGLSWRSAAPKAESRSALPALYPE